VSAAVDLDDDACLICARLRSPCWHHDESDVPAWIPRSREYAGLRALYRRHVLEPQKQRRQRR
jgi:hypothetical protein